MKRILQLLLLCLLVCAIGDITLLHADVCKLSVSVSNEASLPIIDVAFSLDKGATIYAESVSVVFPEEITAENLQAPSADLHEYTGTFLFRYAVPQRPFNFTVNYQACTEGVCYMPTAVNFAFDGKDGVARLEPEATSSEKDDTSLDSFAVVAQANGYQSPRKFLELCSIAQNDALQDTSNPLEKVFDKYGFIIALLLLIPLGAMLNFTPCVLPMIPINLAIIGAAGGSRSAILSRSTVYSCGMMLAYGCMGVITVLTGSLFGGLNASPAFNFAIAAIFIILALSLFDLFSIDLSRWRGSVKTTSLLGTFVMGGLTAILSSACVAPVLIWAMLLATSLYSQGMRPALLMPFFLGLGMALPWPLLALGLTRLPRPGNWMVRVRQAFGILIAIFAIYYVITGIRLMDKGARTREGWSASLKDALSEARRDSKPLLIEFTGKSCKACDTMDRTTFRNKQVLDTLTKFALLEVNIDEKSPENTLLIDRFKIIGAPSFVFLKCSDRQNQGHSNLPNENSNAN